MNLTELQYLMDEYLKEQSDMDETEIYGTQRSVKRSTLVDFMAWLKNQPDIAETIYDD